MMLHRSSSSRRRRASRSAASSPQNRTARSGSQPPPSSPRRASIAASSEQELPTAFQRSPRGSVAPDSFHSPRPSITPDNDSQRPTDLLDYPNSRNMLVPMDRSPRHSLAPDISSYNKSPRNSLVPENYNRSPRHSMVPEIMNRSPRGSIIPDSALSPRNSLAPNVERSSRNNLVPDLSYGSRLSLNPNEFNRSPRGSIAPDPGARSPRHSLVPESSSWNQSRNSLVPDSNRSPRNSIAIGVADFTRTSRSSGCPDKSVSPRTSPRGSLIPDSGMNRSPRGSICPEMSRSPRGSIGPESNSNQKSPRGSLTPADFRGTRGSLVGGDQDLQRSPRGSLTLTFQEPLTKRRSSDDNGTTGVRGRSASPYRGSVGGASVSGRGTQNHGYSGSVWSEGGSRRASSSVSQVSGDEQRRLCGEQSKLGAEAGLGAGLGLGLGLGLTTYGSVAYQLKDANIEASGTCDFVCRAVRIVNKTVVVTVLLACLSSLPLIMLIMGVQYLRDCPREPHIPVYMVVGGSVGCVKMAWVLWQQLGTRSVGGAVAPTASIGSRIASICLTMFLIAWFSLGNYWILRIKWPDYEPTLFEPNKWCHKTLYTFSLVHLCIVYFITGLMVMLVVVLACCQVIGCPWLGPARFK